MPSKRPRKGRCGAKLRKKPGQFCLAWPIRGTKRCRLHGGLTPSGFASPHFRHGKYSRHLSGAFAEAFATRLDDPELLSLRDDIAIADTRLLELVGQAQSDSSAANWKRCGELVREYDRIKADTIEATEKYKLQAPIMVELWSLIYAGEIAEQKWEEARKQNLFKSRLIDSERKRMVEAGLMIAIDDARGLVANLCHLIRDHVHDPEILTLLSDGIARITGERRNAIVEADPGNGKERD